MYGIETRSAGFRMPLGSAAETGVFFLHDDIRAASDFENLPGGGLSSRFRR